MRTEPRAELSRREQILDAAVELFATLGYRGTSIASVTDRVGITGASMADAVHCYLATTLGR